MATNPQNAAPGVPRYHVGPSHDASPRGRPPLTRTAVFVAHGMGQQIPFQTMDTVAQGLLEADARRSGAPSTRPRSVRSFKDGDQWLSRIELQLQGEPGAAPVETHVYEAYWASMTEGKVTLRDVIRFLAAAGRNGIRNARSGVFMRWLFGRYEPYPISVRTLFYLLIALGTIGSLVVMNSTIAVVSAGRALLAEPPGWLTQGLFDDLTTIFNAVITTMSVVGLALGLGVGLRALRIPAVIRQGWSGITAVLFVVAMTTVLVAGVSIPVLFYAHIRGGAQPGEQLLYRRLSQERVDGFNAAFDAWAWQLALALVAILVGWWLVRVAMAFFKDVTGRAGGPHTVIVTVVFAAMIYAVAWVVIGLAGIPGSEGAAAARTGLAWIMLVGISGYIRKVLVQFMGDVAVYVMPYRLDAFADLRREIRDCAWKVAKSIYSLKRADGTFEYDKVIIVGHSLGSVVAYDTLNQLIREDEAANGALHVVERTPMLLTFGSPLDKTAFIFSLQGHRTSEAREALAASVQPLIQSYNFRPTRWVNLYSPWDIVSGALNYYDSANSEEAKRVENITDPEATTLLVAHTEFWDNHLLFDRIHGAIGGERLVDRSRPMEAAAR